MEDTHEPRLQGRRRALLFVAVVLLVVLAAAIRFSTSRRAILERVAQTRALLHAAEEDPDASLGEPFDPEDVRRLSDAERFVEEDLSAYPTLAAELRTQLSHIQRQRGELARALELARAARAEAQAESGENAPLTLAALEAEGLALLDQGRFQEAEVVLRSEREGWVARGEGGGHDGCVALHNLAIALEHQKKYAEPEALYRECLAGRSALLGEEHELTLATRVALARLLLDSGRDPEAAIELLRGAHAVESRTLGAGSPRTLVTASMLGDALVTRGQLAEARPILRGVAEALERALGPDHPDTFAARRTIAKLHAMAGEHEEARSRYLQLLAWVRDRLPEDDEVRRTVEAEAIAAGALDPGAER